MTNPYRALLAQPEAESTATQLAARPLLERVARMGDRIGQHTMGEVMAISDQAAGWLEANPPCQPVAIEPRGCPTPGACSCVETGAQSEPEGLTDEELLELMPQQFRDDLAMVSRTAAHGAGPDITPGIFRVSLNTGALSYARAAIAADRARRPTPHPQPSDLTQIALQMLGTIESMELIIPEITDTIRKALEQGNPTPQPPADGEVAELQRWGVDHGAQPGRPLLSPMEDGYWTPWHIAADLLQRLASDNAGLEAAAESAYLDNLSLLDSQND